MTQYPPPQPGAVRPKIEAVPNAMKMRSDDDETSTYRCARYIKYIMFGFNILFVIVGLAILAFGVWIKVDRRFREFLDNAYRQEVTSDYDAPTLQIMAYIIIILSICMILVSFFGCCGAVRESQALLILYFVCILILFVASLSIGIYLIVKKDAIENEVGDALTYMVQNYYQGAGVVQQALDAIQETFRCCGSSGCADFRFYSRDIPRTCDIDCGGCKVHVYTALRQGFTVLSVVFVIVLLAQLVDMVLTMVLFFLVRRPEHRARAYRVPVTVAKPSQPQAQAQRPTPLPPQPRAAAESQPGTLEKKIRPIFSPAPNQPGVRPPPPRMAAPQPRPPAPQRGPPQHYATSGQAMPPPPYNARYVQSNNGPRR